MAYTTDYLYQYALRLIKKNQAGGLPSKDFTYLWSAEQASFHSDLLGRFQANRGLIQNETILQKLSPFMGNNIALAVSAGFATKPTDIAFRLALRVNDIDAVKITHDQIFNINDDVLGDAPSIAKNKYYFVEDAGKYRMFPTAVSAAKLDYIKVPKDIVWAYKIAANGQQQYNDSGITRIEVIYGGVGYTTPTITFSAPAAGGVQATGTLTIVGGVVTAVVMTNIGFGYAGLTPTFTITGASTTPAVLGNPVVSVQPLWGNSECLEITERMLKKLGVSFKDADFAGLGQSIINTGN